jgi:hypothetical protein
MFHHGLSKRVKETQIELFSKLFVTNSTFTKEKIHEGKSISSPNIMVSTRMQTIVVESSTIVDTPISKKHSKLSLKPHRNLVPSSSGLKIAKSPRKPIKRDSPNRKEKHRSQRASTTRTKLTDVQADQLSAAISPVTPPHISTQAQRNPNPSIEGDFSRGNTFFPSVIFGEHEQVGLSKIGRADKEVRMWEQVLIEHEREQPSLIPVVEEKVKEAKERRASIDESLEENYRVGCVSLSS